MKSSRLVKKSYTKKMFCMLSMNVAHLHRSRITVLNRQHLYEYGHETKTADLHAALRVVGVEAVHLVQQVRKELRYTW
jgi:hypothetical protein